MIEAQKTEFLLLAQKIQFFDAQSGLVALIFCVSCVLGTYRRVDASERETEGE